eukprot:7313474-Alexandrium_andersonii.AAC.1
MAPEYALIQQTARGVGPGTRSSVKEEDSMEVDASSEPLLKRQRMSGTSTRKQLAYVLKVLQNPAYRRAEGLLG